MYSKVENTILDLEEMLPKIWADFLKTCKVIVGRKQLKIKCHFILAELAGH